MSTLAQVVSAAVLVGQAWVVVVVLEVAASMDMALGCTADTVEDADCAGCDSAMFHTAAVGEASSLAQLDCPLSARIA